MCSKRVVTSFVSTCVTLMFLSFPIHLFAAEQLKLNVGYSAISYDQLPAWIAKETGIFSKNGLDVQLVYFAGGTTATMAMVSGDVGISQNSGPAVVSAYLSGSDLVFACGGTVTLDYWLMSKPNIKSPAQLKGGSVAISRLGSGSDVVARFMLRKIGLIPDKEVAIVQVGTTPDRLVAVVTGRVEATVLNPPTMFIAKRQGLNLLADISELGIPYQGSGVITTRKFAREHSEIVRRYVKSQVEAVHRIKTDRETALKVTAKYFGRLTDQESIEMGYERLLGENKLPRKQYPSVQGISTILEMLQERNPKAKTIKPEDLVDNRFVKELDAAGYIESLYKKGK